MIFFFLPYGCNSGAVYKIQFQFKENPIWKEWQDSNPNLDQLIVWNLRVLGSLHPPSLKINLRNKMTTLSLQQTMI